MHREFGIIHSYTLEISFCGATQGVLKDTHFSQKVLKVSKNLEKLRNNGNLCTGYWQELLQSARKVL